MSGLAASRWASTPVQEEEKQLDGPTEQQPAAEQELVADATPVEEKALAKTEPTASDEVVADGDGQTAEDDHLAEPEVAELSKPKSGQTKLAESSEPKSEQTEATALSWADDVEDSAAVAQPTASAADEKPNSSVVDQTDPQASDVPQLDIPATTRDAAQPGNKQEAEPAAQPFRLEPPRLKKRVSWRNKNCMINIPSLDFNALGLPMPMTLEEARQRIAYFDAAVHEAASEQDHTTPHVRPIWPDEQESRNWRRGSKAIVSIPDLNALKAYQDALLEAKLASLGVGTSESAPSPQPEDMSRQTSSTYPTAFSPPIPTNSANGMRPAFVRGHSHTMSVASPITPGNGPFGHMHRHSTFHGFSPLQAQDLSRQAFSPASPFNLPSVQTIASPAQLNIVRNDFGLIRGPGSPLSQSMTPDPMEQQRQKLQSLMQQPPLPPSQFPQRTNFEQIPALPELPEDEDEEDLSDPVPYVPPHKRAQINEDIVVPTPRHRHNISEGLEREVLHIEQQQQQRDFESNGRLGSFGQAPKLFGQISDEVPSEKDPLSGDYAVLDSSHSHKRSGSRFNVTAAPAFTFNPAATFKPGSSAFTFGAAPAAKRSSKLAHTRQVSSGNFNASAPEFKPSASVDGPAPPSSDFNFSAQGPAFSTTAGGFVPPVVAVPAHTVVDDLPSIFGKITIPDIVKPTKKSKAITIVNPSDVSASATDAEDADGRIGRSDERQKRSRRAGGDSGDEVPQFAIPSPAPPLPTVPVVPSQHDETAVRDYSASTEDQENSVPKGDAAQRPSLPTHKANNSSLSALAQPWQPSGLSQVDSSFVKDESESHSEEGEVRDHDTADLEAVREPQAPTTTYPSFDEIDAVMQHLNGDGDTMPGANDYEPQEGVEYLAEMPRSDAPSPSPKRQHMPRRGSPPAQLISDNPWSEINRLNKASGPPSDWSDMLSPAEDEKLQARSSFFDNRIDDVVGRVLADRLRPFEDALQNIQLSLRKNPPLERRSSKHRSSSAVDSDADDEDDSDLPRLRPVSRGRDDKLGHIKAVVLEALREQSPQRSQSAYDIADLHGALADMKMSFARAASSGLELDDIKAIVEDAVARQPASAPLPATEAIDNAEHKRQLTELEGKLNDTLTNALEQANRMYAVEQREAEARRSLKLAEEELRLLREDNDDGSNRSRAFEGERNTLLERLDEAKDAHAKSEDRSEALQTEVEALEATLEEYRESAKHWRLSAEEHKLERESLQTTVQALERQLQDAQESGSGIKRRLEKLHADMATASGQLASEKNRWRTREEAFRAQCEALESQVKNSAREKAQLQEEHQTLQARAVDFDGLQISHSGLDEMVKGLRADLQASKALASQFEHDFKEATESGRAEVQRVRLAMELDVEAANHRANLLRAELEGENARVRAELDSVRLEADTAKEKHALMLDEEAEIRNAHMHKLQVSSSTALDEARLKYEGAVRELTQQHSRSFAHAIEDKERSEYLLNERLSLADAKLQHYQDRIKHLEERVEIAKTAAHAAAASAKSPKATAPAYRSTGLPEKVSPQALRESILVLQEQLQERELRIEKLQQTLRTNGPAKIKERDTEISWLRELLTVRGEELTDLVNTLSKPTFDRAAVRDTAIRIRANLDMEQQEKERSTAPIGQAIASLTSFATPNAAQLSSVFNKWRTSMESTALKSRSPTGSANRSATPSRAPSVAKGSYGTIGLMTPPTSNLRSSPSPEATTSVPAPKLSARRESKSQKEERASPIEEPPSTPNLFGTSNYDEDAEDRAADMSNLEDDDLNIADSRPPAFRSLEDELNEPAEAED